MDPADLDHPDTYHLPGQQEREPQFHDTTRLDYTPQDAYIDTNVADTYQTNDHPSYQPQDAYQVQQHAQHAHPYLVPSQFQPPDHFAQLQSPAGQAVYRPAPLQASPPGFELSGLPQLAMPPYNNNGYMHPVTPTNPHIQGSANSSARSRHSRESSATSISSPHTPNSASHGGMFVHRQPMRGHHSHSQSPVDSGSGSGASMRRSRRGRTSGREDESDDIADMVSTSIKQRKDEARTQRMNAEQRRRDELRVAYSRLQKVLPTTKDKMSKVRLVDFATSHIGSLNVQIQEMQKTIQRLEVEARRLRTNESVGKDFSVSGPASDVQPDSIPFSASSNGMEGMDMETAATHTSPVSVNTGVSVTPATTTPVIIPNHLTPNPADQSQSQSQSNVVGNPAAAGSVASNDQSVGQAAPQNGGENTWAFQ